MRGRFSKWLSLALAPTVLAPAHATEAASPSLNDGQDKERALQCMTLAIAYEAGFEPVSGRQAVGEVILNRMRSPSYPKSICGVVFQGSARRTGCQFTFTCDGAMKRPLSPAVISAARDMANKVLSGDFTPTAPGATHYHANYVSPYWAPTLVRLTRIGAHIFYRNPGSAGDAARYAVVQEPAVGGSAILAQAQGEENTAPQQEPPSPARFTLWGLAPTRP